MAKYKVLSTKELKASLADHVKEKGIGLVQQEFISIKPITGLDKNIKDLLQRETLVFTSANAVNIIGKYLGQDTELNKKHTVFCLGGKTREAVIENGFKGDMIAAVGENATALAEEIIRKGVKEIVFFCGSKRREELPSLLKAAGVEIIELAIYETTERPLVIKGEWDGILFFSPSAVTSFFSSNHIKKGTVCFTIGQTTANAVKQLTPNKIIISKEPSQEAITEAVITYFQNINQNND